MDFTNPLKESTLYLETSYLRSWRKVLCFNHSHYCRYAAWVMHVQLAIQPCLQGLITINHIKFIQVVKILHLEILYQELQRLIFFFLDVFYSFLQYAL